MSLKTYRDHNVDDPDQLVTVLANIGVALLQEGKYAEAEAYFIEAIDVARQNKTSEAYLAVLYSNMGGAQKNLGRDDEATASYVEAATILERTLGPEHPETITTLTSLANHYRQVGEMTLAASTIRKAVAAAENALPEVDFIGSYVQNVGGAILCLGEDISLGTSLAEKSLAARRQLLPAGHWAISSGEGIVGMCHAAAGDFAIAEPILLKAYTDLQGSRGDTHEVTLANRERLQQLYTAWGKPEQAARYAQQATESPN